MKSFSILTKKILFSFDSIFIRLKSRRFLAPILILLSIVCLPHLLQAGDGDLDPTFDGDGKVTTDFGAQEEGHAIAIQANGKIVVAGFSYANSSNFALARYNTNGSLDSSFGGDGQVTTDFNGEVDIAYAVAIQPDGKIVAAGWTYSGDSVDFALARYNANGNLDSSFDGDGKVTTDFNGTDDEVHAVAIQSDGKIVAAGGDFGFHLARYNADGSLDSSFDGDGKVTTNFGGRAYGVVIQPDGKIVIAGSAASDFAVARYNTNGSLDSSFDFDGKVTTDIGGGDSIQSLTLQTEGKIVVAGYSTASGTNDFALARYNADGGLDSSFDGDGIVITDFGGTTDHAQAVAIQVDSKIVAAGHSIGGGSDDQFGLARYNADGSLDTSFDADGKVTTNFTGDLDGVEGVAIQAGGKIVAAGYAYNAATSGDFALARYQASFCAGVLSLDSPSYSCSDTISIRLTDSDLIGNGTQNVTATAPGDSETVTLTETPPASGVFSSSINTTTAGPLPNDGILTVSDGVTITVTYNDASFCGSPQTVTAIAGADCVAPIISNVAISNITGSTARVTWNTNEPANSTVNYALAPGPPDQSQTDPAFVTAHDFIVGGLNQCSDYVLSVTSEDPPGNAITDDNGGNFYSLTTTAGLQDDVESGTGVWHAAGNPSDIFHITTCDANSPTHSWKAGPTACGAQYNNDVATFLSSAGSFQIVPGAHLEFMENYSTELNFDFCTVQISTDEGSTWTTLDSYSGDSSGWIAKSYDLSPYAGQNARIRFQFTTDAFVVDTGWLIDDITITPTSCGTCPTITLSPPTLPDGQVGVPYNQTVTASGGTAPYIFAVTSGSLPEGLNLDGATGVISGTPTLEQVANFTIRATESVGCSGNQTYSITVITVNTCLFCDDFEDGVLATNWTYIKNSSFWAESGGNLIGINLLKKTTAFADPAFPAGCTTCYVKTVISTMGGAFNRVWLFFHAQDPKLNLVELMMKEETDRWVLKQRVNKAVVAKAKAIQVIDPNVFYTAQIRYDGTNFVASIDGVDVITLAPAGPINGGSVGFKVKRTTGSFQYIEVNP